MASPVNVISSAASAFAVGGISQITKNMTTGQFTDMLVAGGLGLVGFFGATAGFGGAMMENISVGAVDGAASYLGTRTVQMLNIGVGTQMPVRRIQSMQRPIPSVSKSNPKSSNPVGRASVIEI